MVGKIEDILKKKYEEVEVPDDIFDFDAMNLESIQIEPKNNYIFMKIVAVVMLVVTIILTSFVVELDINYGYHKDNIINTSYECK